MLKVVIADDERMICLLIASLLDWKKYGFEIAGLAYNGVEALELIEKHRPDVVISDIRMPGLDGLELIRKTKEAGIHSEFVMISGFKQFEYAQNAMKYGVKYYLLKPIEEEKLLEIVQEIKAQILTVREQEDYTSHLEAEIQETRDIMRKRFLTSMIYLESPAQASENLQMSEDRNEVNKKYRTNFKEGFYRAVFVKVDTNEEESVDSIIAEIEKRMRILEEVCEEQIMAETHSGVIALCNYQSGREEELPETIERLYEDIKEYAEQFEGFSVVVGVGEKQSDFFRSNLCIRSAIDAIKYRIRFNDRGLIYAENYSFEKYNLEDIMDASMKNEYLSRIESGNIESVIDYLHNFIRKIRYGSDELSPVYYFDALATYVNILMDYCKKKDYYRTEFGELLKQWNIRMDNVKSEKMLFDITAEFIRMILENIAREKEERDAKPVRILKQYIEDHYMQDLSLSRMAEMVGMNASYVSSMFKRETGMTYSEYLFQCRVKQASRLLAETDRSIGEIAETCGYQDARYFSRQFTKLVGLKPSEYRKLYS